MEDSRNLIDEYKGKSNEQVFDALEKKRITLLNRCQYPLGYFGHFCSFVGSLRILGSADDRHARHRFVNFLCGLRPASGPFFV